MPSRLRMNTDGERGELTPNEDIGRPPVPQSRNRGDGAAVRKAVNFGNTPGRNMVVELVKAES